MCATYYTDLCNAMKRYKSPLWDTYTFRQHGEFLIKVVADGKGEDIDKKLNSIA